MQQTSETGRRKTNTISDSELAATKIQAGFRGYQVRKRYHLHDHPHESHTYEERDRQAYSDPSGPYQHQYQATYVRPRTDADKAAAKIQASFRGYMTRRDLKQNKAGNFVPENSGNTPSSWHPADRKDTKAPFKNRDQNPSTQGRTISTAIGDSSPQPKHKGWDHSDPNEAATIIQANFRGYQTRKSLHPTREHKPPSTTAFGDRPTGMADKENAEQAATRIQASYRGFRTRKQLEQMHITPKSKHVPTDPHNITDPEYAATKIQAAFRGYSTRQRVHLPHHDQ